MSRLVAAVALAGVALISAPTPGTAAPKPPAHHEQADGCDHGHTGKPCRPDPRPTNGKDCQLHGNHGGVNEAHCGPSTPAPTTTGGTPSTTPTATTSTTSTASPSHQPSATSQSPSPTSSTSTTRSTNGTTSHTEPPAMTSPPQIASTTRSTPMNPSPRRSVPSSTVAPPNRLARTGADIGSALVLAAILLVGGAFILISRKGGAHR